MMEALKVALTSVTESIPLFIAAFVILLVGKAIYDKTTSFSFDAELTTNDNPAFGVVFAGYLVALAIALGGAFDGTDGLTVNSAITLGYGGLLAIILMRISVWINDTCILNKFSVEKELIEDKNAGTGFVVAGGCIATGLMLSGVLTGESDTLLLGVRDIAVYFVAGQVLLVIGAKLFATVAKYDVHAVIENDDNLPAGISLGGFLIAIGIIAKTTLAGASSAIANELVVTFATAAVAIPVLLASSIIADKIFLPKHKLADEIAVDKNPAAGAVSFAVYVVVALLLAAAVNPA
jgi:uncharacterized membrane protein YjfL (UPF0719 family)